MKFQGEICRRDKDKGCCSDMFRYFYFISLFKKRVHMQQCEDVEVRLVNTVFELKV